MNWYERYPRSQQPTPAQIAGYIETPLWGEFCRWVERSYGIEPKTEHSTCSGAPGWNVKYRKGGRALCTLYPDAGAFTALVTVGAKQAAEAELLLPTFSEPLRELYARTKEYNGARWLMIRVTDARMLEDVRALIRLRAAPQEK
ncbi:MAG: DUF3788 domain-containing protein [Clostridiales bacterium]|nr:DUF3788 domain-containing protein [Clostridiales bacterium]